MHCTLSMLYIRLQELPYVSFSLASPFFCAKTYYKNVHISYRKEESWCQSTGLPKLLDYFTLTLETQKTVLAAKQLLMGRSGIRCILLRPETHTVQRERRPSTAACPACWAMRQKN